jgi:LPS O-antigen subunit length determinant protein (WzzB/FepE family)
VDTVSDDRVISQSPPAPSGIALIWKRRLWVVAATALGLLAAVITLHVVTFKYTATMAVTPVQPNTAALPSGLAGLANLAGAQFGRGEVAKPFVLYVQLLTSDRVAARLAEDEVFKRHVFANQWDAASNQWRQPPSLTRGLVEGLKSILGIPSKAWAPPGAADVKRWLELRLGVSEDPKNGLATVTLTDPDPAFAVATLAKIHSIADSELRARELARSQNYIAYLTRTIASVQLSEHRAALAATLGDQERKRMVASANTAFAAEPLGPIVASDKPNVPKPLSILLSGLAGGLILGLLLALNWPQRGRFGRA